MLKVSVVDSRGQQTLVVEGSLTAPWASELESVWKQILQAGRNRKIVVDLGSATAIDATGRAVLTAMVANGTELVGKGLYTEYLVKSLVDRARTRRFDLKVRKR
jgi:anti-anti-sigma regulatory factor